MAKSKSKGTTPESLHGKTAAPIDGVIAVQVKDCTFDHDHIKVESWRVLTDENKMHWFNTYEETNSDGTLTPKYTGEGTSTAVNSTTVKGLDDFQARCVAKGGYRAVDADDYPPQCVSAEVEDDEDDIEVEDEINENENENENELALA